MASKLVNEQVAAAQKILDTWSAHTTTVLAGMTLTDFQTQVTALLSEDDALTAERVKVKGMSENLGSNIAALNGTNSRLLSGIRSTFGPDSKEYAQAGGTRTSERKKPTRGVRTTTSPKS